MIRRVVITPATAAPVGSVGVELATAFGGISLINVEILLEVRLFIGAGAVSADLFLWGRRLGLWGPQGDAAGQLNGGVTVSGTTERVYYKVLCNQSAFDRIYVQAANPSVGLNLAGSLFIITNPPPPA